MTIKIFDVFTDPDEQYKCWWGEYYIFKVRENSTITRFRQRCFKIPPAVRKRILKEWERKLLNKRVEFMNEINYSSASTQKL